MLPATSTSVASTRTPWFDRKALLKGIRLAVQDPARVIGVTSHMTTARKPEQAMAEAPGRRRVDLHPLMAYQHLDFLPAFFNNRTAWSRGNYMLCSPGAFATGTATCSRRSEINRVSSRAKTSR